ncbi:MAG: hypothetical protein ACI9G1_003608 [Pirellulaceae bacterium]|jgi:hypothetical protein
MQMKANRATSVDDYKLLSSFEAVRKTLQSDLFTDRLEKTLAYWVLPNDRRLPLAFLPRTLQNLLDTPFEDLTATPGVGQKKIGSLVKLLRRATEEQTPAAPFGLLEFEETNGPDNQNGSSRLRINRDLSDTFTPELVSELIWSKWRETVTHHRMEDEKLGFLTPSLQALPTVIWFRPLAFYLDKTLEQIRSLKTHGEKRIHGVLEVFYVINRMLAHVRPNEHVAIRMSPRFAVPVDNWITDRLRSTDLPSAEELKGRLCEPLLEQLKTDVGEEIASLARGRLGLDGEIDSVRDQAQRMNVTRTRVYQLLDDCCRAIDVRWPEGRCRLDHLMDRFRREGRPEHRQAMELFANLIDLFFSGKQEPLAN